MVHIMHFTLHLQECSFAFVAVRDARATLGSRLCREGKWDQKPLKLKPGKSASIIFEVQINKLEGEEVWTENYSNSRQGFQSTHHARQHRELLRSCLFASALPQKHARFFFERDYKQTKQRERQRVTRERERRRFQFSIYDFQFSIVNLITFLNFPNCLISTLLRGTLHDVQFSIFNVKLFSFPISPLLRGALQDFIF